ncbi:platelet endothelial aggregation receptor 1-like isoform X1 [Saccostrea cucullata]|uniref:platelet endothelial aggregation receptor 1-like isoform X1 n=1 Tax=Saccostrea cuccullata TaxID=36930 RepID=UPI002ED6B0A7
MHTYYSVSNMKSGTALIYFLGEISLIGKIAEAYENLALRKPTWQQYPYMYNDWPTYLDLLLYNYPADKAVDGLFSDRSNSGGQCTISGNQKRTATWRVDLGKVLNIHHITIYYRTDNLPWGPDNGYTSRFLGFSLFISNTTNKDDGYLCFKDTHYTRETIPSNITIECIKHGRYVIYYNERLPGVTYPEGYSTYAFNELCEVQVYGCPSFVIYGENCTFPCPQTCREGSCNIVDGTCFGCIAGHRGSRCEKFCDGGKFGQNCAHSCGSCLDKEQCHHINGSCLNGCDRGYYGDRCTQVCSDGWYGYNYLDMCDVNCGERTRCDRKTGQCQNGCQPGWKDIECDKKCDGGKFGLNCAQSCGVCLDNKQCHHINGTCLNGCDKGYHGDTCTQECPDGRFGYNCEGNCSSCPFIETCDAISGQCNVIRGSPDYITWIQSKTFLFGVTTSFSISVGLNLALILWRCSRNGCKRKKNQENFRIQLSTKPITADPKIIDDAGDSEVYEELDRNSIYDDAL